MLAAPPAQPLTVAASSHRPGARAVALSLTLRTELQCGRLTGAPLVVRLPRPPARLPAGSVRLGGRPASTTFRRGLLVVGELPPAGAVCDSIIVGPLRLSIRGLANPARRGTYRVTVSHGADLYAGSLRVG
jgi:hypothetical protein